ncbi:MAG TPA: DUF1858 domain-containing protein [Anaerolineales bacterium]
MQNPSISPEATVAEVLDRWPQAVPVFLKYHTSCVGCGLSAFETLAEAARNYRLPLAQLMDDLRRATQGLDSSSSNAKS